MQQFFSRLLLGSQAGKRPRAVVEIAPAGVIAASLPPHGQHPVIASSPLENGLVTPGLIEPNIHSMKAVASAVSSALAALAYRDMNVTLIVPNKVARVFILDFDTLPTNRAESISVLRFRLRKLLPLDLEKTKIGYQVLSRDETGCKVLAVVIPSIILEEYEEVISLAGYKPGVVLPSHLAGLAILDSANPTLAAYLDEGSLTTVFAHGNDLMLFRTVELPENRSSRLLEIERAIAVASAFFEDKLAHGRGPSHLLYAGTEAVDDFAQLTGGIKVTPIDFPPHTEKENSIAPRYSSMAGIAGALVGTV